MLLREADGGSADAFRRVQRLLRRLRDYDKLHVHSRGSAVAKALKERLL